MCDYLETQEKKKEEDITERQKDVNQTLAYQMTLPKNNALKKDGPLDLERCGPSSLQCFDGEDREHDERRKLQQQQLQIWCMQGIHESSSKQRQEEQKENEYATYVLEEDNVRCTVAKESELQKRQDKVDVMQENMLLAEERRIAKMNEDKLQKELERKETEFISSSSFYCEETESRKGRPDHFKGFSSDKLQSIIADNEQVALEKQLLKEEEKNLERDWASYGDDLVAQMDIAEIEKNEWRQKEKELLLQTLAQQREEQMQAKRMMEQERRELFSGETFFSKFGTSCR